MESIDVVEFGTYLAGPLLGKYLCDFGCNVTCIIRPLHVRGVREERQRMKHMTPNLQAGKTILEVDLCKKLDHVKRLIKTSRVIIENFKPGTMETLGLGFETCKAINPDILYISLPGFAKEDADFQNIRGYESILLAAAGIFCDMGLNRQLLGIPASYSPLPLASVYGSIYGSFAVVSALLAQRRGEYICIPLASAVTECMIHNSSKFPKDKVYMNMREQCLKSGRYPVDEETLKTLIDPFFCVYECADKRGFYLVVPAHKKHQLNALKALEIDASLFPHIQNPYDETENYGVIGCGNLSRHHAEIIRPYLIRAFLKKTAFEWERIMTNFGVPGVAVRTCKEWKNSRHVKDAGLIRNGRLANIGWICDPKPCVGYLGKKNCGPHLLSGFKVLDLSNVIAGPTIGYMFARMGADVIKIDAPNPLYAPEVSVVYGLAANQGKRSILLDVYSPEGKRTLDVLMKSADLLIVNCTTPCLERMHLTRDEIRAINPNLVLMQFDAFSGPNKNKGFLCNNVGYDDCVQACSGIMARFGGDLYSPEEHAQVGLIDVISGVAGATVCAVALFERDENHLVYTARSSLAAVGQFLQFPQLLNVSRSICGLGKKCVGENEYHRCYRTKHDKYFMLVTFSNKSKKALRTMLKMPPTEDSFLHWDVDEICKCLRAINIAAYPLQNMSVLRNKYLTHVVNFQKTFQFLLHDHPIGMLEMVAPIAIHMNGVLQNICHAPKYGYHTQEVLSELGIKDINLITSWSRNYIPYSSKCECCFQRGRKNFVLTCNHTVCFTCLLKTRNTCSVCQQPRGLSENIRKKIDEYRSGYSNWRMGNAHGCRDMELVIKPSYHLRSSKSNPNF